MRHTRLCIIGSIDPVRPGDGHPAVYLLLDSQLRAAPRSATHAHQELHGGLSAAKRPQLHHLSPLRFHAGKQAHRQAVDVLTQHLQREKYFRLRTIREVGRSILQAIIGNYAVPILEEKQVWGTNDQTRTAYLDTTDVARMTLAALRSVLLVNVVVSTLQQASSRSKRSCCPPAASQCIPLDSRQYLS
jgi:hypothetical protein